MDNKNPVSNRDTMQTQKNTKLDDIIKKQAESSFMMNNSIPSVHFSDLSR